jgi:hypothetical protein
VNIHETPTAHTPEHEALLVAALADERVEHAGEWVARLAQCEECRQRFEKLCAVRDLLDDAGREERDTLASLDLNQSVPGSDTVEPFVRALAQKRKRQLRSAHTRRVALWAASAAAGVLFVGWVVRLLAPPSPVGANDTLLGAHKKASCSPDSPVVEYGEFKWDLPLPPQGEFELVIWDDRPDAPLDAVFRKPKLDTNSWTLSPAEARALPDKIRWEVHVFDATGAQLPGLPSTRAERSPH